MLTLINNLDIRGMASQWELVGDVPKEHKFFRHKETGQIGVADRSAKYPHQTEDGILWLHTDKPLEVAGGFTASFIAHVTKNSSGEDLHILCSEREVVFLIKQFGMHLKLSADGHELIMERNLDGILDDCEIEA